MTRTDPSAGMAGSAYPSYVFQAQGGVPPYAWSESGTLPPGMGLAASGELAGTPTVAGTYPIAVTVSDSASPQVAITTALALVISDPPIVVSSSASLPAGVVSQTYTSFGLMASGGSPPYSWSATGQLPPGLALQPDGTIVGTPTTPGIFQFSIVATDSAQTAESSSQVPVQIVVTSPRRTGGAALALAATRRIDVILLGDSNAYHWQAGQDTTYGGSGWAGGLEYALGQKFGLYATGIYAGAFNGGAGLNGYYAWPEGATLVTTGAGGIAEQYEPAGQLPIPWDYSYVSAGSADPGYLAIASGGAIDVTHALRGHFAYGTFASGSGSFRPGVRSERAPYTDIIDAANAISTNDGVGGQLAFASIDVPAGALSGGADGVNQYSFRAVGTAAGLVATGPFLSYYSRIEDRQATEGASVSVMYGLGGKGLWDYAEAVITAPDLELWMILNEARRLQVQQGLKPVVVMFVNAGVNDRNYTTQKPSWGPLQLNVQANSVANYMDNLAGLMNRIESLYARYWDVSELSWIIMPSHPQSSPDDPSLLGYRAAVDQLASSTPSMTAIDLGNLVTSTQMTANGWYDSQGTPHLSQAGYDAIAQIALDFAVLH